MQAVQKIWIIAYGQQAAIGILQCGACIVWLDQDTEG